jgi:hypothetical protein
MMIIGFYSKDYGGTASAWKFCSASSVMITKWGPDPAFAGR